MSIINFRELEVGGVYNRTYKGPNESYKKQNGKTTFRVVSIEGDRFKGTDLYAQYPDTLKELRSNSWSADLHGFVNNEEYDFEKVTEDSQYYKHSQVMTMKDAVEEGLISIDTIKHVFRNKSKDFIRENPVAYVQKYDEERNMIYPPARHITLSVIDGVSDNPLLQTIYFYWENTDEFEKDVRSVYSGAWFMH